MLFGTDFELWPNISLQLNRIIINNLKIINVRAPKVGELWSRNAWKLLASFCPPPKFSHWETLPVLQHGRYITDSRQTSARFMTVERAYSIEQQNAGGRTLGFAMHLVYYYIVDNVRWRRASCDPRWRPYTVQRGCATGLPTWERTTLISAMSCLQVRVRLWYLLSAPL